MAHLNKLNIGKSWPIPRKGSKYSTLSSHNHKESIPLVIVMRDILKIVRNRKELQKSINEKQIFVNQKQIRETSFPISVLDIISIPKINAFVISLIINAGIKVINFTSSLFLGAGDFDNFINKAMSVSLVCLSINDLKGLAALSKNFSVVISCWENGL